MRSVKIEGFEVLIEMGKESVTFTIPKLPGIVGQVKSEKEVKREARILIGAYLKELVSDKPAIRNSRGVERKNGDGSDIPKTKA